jgi:YD repeat-containing protein
MLTPVSMSAAISIFVVVLMRETRALKRTELGWCIRVSWDAFAQVTGVRSRWDKRTSN